MKFDRRQFLKILPAVPTVGLAVEPKSYRGMSDSAGWRSEAYKRIEKHRKDDFKVRIIDPAKKPIKNLTVDLSLYRHHFGFGAAPKLARFYDKKFSAEIRGLYHDFCEVLFHKLTPENSLKWKHYKNNAKFTEPFLEWCKQKKIPVRGHCLVWPEFRRAPKSIERFRSDQEGLGSAIREHIKFMVNSFNYPVTEWDVLNEAVNHDEYMRILGKDVVKEWFQLVKDMNPNVKRYINDYSILTKNNVRHRKRYFQYIKGLLDSGVPIDGIGFQSHIPKGFNPTPPEEIIRIANDFSGLGPELQVTEFDFETSNRDLQAQYTEDFMTAIFSQPKMTGLITWTPFEYAKNNVPKPEAALIDKDLQFKPNGMVWYELINKRWMTKTIVSTDDNGYLKFRGFKGRYLASISHSKKEILDIDLSESNELVITLT